MVRVTRSSGQADFACAGDAIERQWLLTIKKTQSESATKAQRGASGTAAPALRPLPANGSAAPKEKEKATCEGALRRVIALAQATLQESRSGEPRGAQPAEPSGAGPVSVPGPTKSGRATQEQATLEQALEGLDSEVALKLRTLMIAGRDGKTIGDINVNLTLDDSKGAFAAAAVDTSQNVPLLADYLRRGHALACAAALDLERPLASWGGSKALSLDERAWLSFGKQLAKAGVDDWQCLAFVDGNQCVSRLYLRLQGHAWWSFQAVLDRPSAAMVEKHERSLSSRRSKGLSTRSLSALASRLASIEGRALRRAARAIRARVGEASAS